MHFPILYTAAGHAGEFQAQHARVSSQGSVEFSAPRQPEAGSFESATSLW